MTRRGPYGRAVGAYRQLGWGDVIPVREKFPPIEGFTGGYGAGVTDEDVARWCGGEQGRWNIALRLPSDVIGLDVDAGYGGKEGNVTLSKAELEWGPLPPTWKTTSRGANQPAGILLFRVPAGLDWSFAEGRILERFGKHVEVIRRSHRYCMVWPSIHPDLGEVYAWYDPDERASNFAPAPGDLGEMPERWVQGLTAPPEPKPRPTYDPKPQGDAEGDGPWEDYDARADWAELLEADGAQLHHRKGDVEHWRRPGKTRGWSATLGHCADDAGRPMLHVFTTDWPALIKDATYTPFGYYTATKHDGDRSAAAKALYALGYGEHLDHHGRPCGRTDCPNPPQRATKPPPDPPDDEWDWPTDDPTEEGSAASAAPSAPPSDEPAVELYTFLADPDDDYDWLIPDLIERGDRIIITGLEGGGKTTLLRQVAVQTGSGIHPFTLEPIDPLRVLYVDLENSRRQDRRQFRPLAIKAGQALAAGQVHVVIQPSGIDLLHQADVTWLAARIEATKPDLLCVGPMYKLANGDPIKEEIAKGVVVALDRLRDTYSLALLIEAHVPYASGNGKRPERPYGASIWSRWPEFGIYLDPSGALRHWRGARDEREWPTALKRGGHWPWTVETSATDAAWKTIVSWFYANRRTASERDLAAELRISKSTVHRAIKDHEAWWAKLQAAAAERENENGL